MPMLELGLLAGLVGCFFAAAILSAAEVSIIRVRRSECLVAAEGGDPREAQLLGLLDSLPVLLNSVLFLVLLLQVAAATIGAFLAERWFGGLGVTVTTVLLTLVLFVYAEAIPKTRAVRRPHEMALRFTPLLRVVVAVLRPLVRVLVALADLQSPGTGDYVGAITETEIRALAQESAVAGEIAEHDAALVDRSFEFNDCLVKDVMVPRHLIAAVRVDQNVLSVLSSAIAVGHRRLPVYRHSLDHVVGVVRLRDVASAARNRPATSAGDLAVNVLRCRPEQLVSELLRDMQETKTWLAIVTDDSNATVGLVTIEDVAAELLGEITDDHDHGTRT